MDVMSTSEGDFEAHDGFEATAADDAPGPEDAISLSHSAELLLRYDRVPREAMDAS